MNYELEFRYLPLAISSLPTATAKNQKPIK